VAGSETDEPVPVAAALVDALAAAEAAIEEDGLRKHTCGTAPVAESQESAAMAVADVIAVVELLLASPSAIVIIIVAAVRAVVEVSAMARVELTAREVLPAADDSNSPVQGVDVANQPLTSMAVSGNATPWLSELFGRRRNTPELTSNEPLLASVNSIVPRSSSDVIPSESMYSTTRSNTSSEEFVSTRADATPTVEAPVALAVVSPRTADVPVVAVVRYVSPPPVKADEDALAVDSVAVAIRDDSDVAGE